MDKQELIFKIFANYEKKHGYNLLHQSKTVDRLYDALCKEAARLGQLTKFNDPNQPFYFSDYPETKKKFDKMMSEFADSLQSTIEEGDKTAWELSNQKNDRMLDVLTKGTTIPKDKLKEWRQSNLDALQAFQQRKVGLGMQLSERVWNLAEQAKQELELALDLGLGEGKSAADLSRDVRRYLNEPNKLFRRVRDKHGVLRLSKAAQAYHPGRGVYRSSYKNAMRLTRTENNMAYRRADHTRWGQMNFVIGQEVKLSNNHTLNGVPFEDMCDFLAGKYPKEFDYTGWHPHCRCFVVPILADWNEQLKVMEKEMNGEDVSNYHYKGEVKDMPEGFTQWVKDNRERIARAKSMPYFIRDNYVGGRIEGGLKWKTAEKEKTHKQSIIDAARARQAARTPEQIQDILDRRALWEDEKQYSPEQREMFRKIEQELGMKRGFSMPYLRADRQKANPLRDRHRMYQINCQTCAPAYVLREWGFDVYALGNTEKAGNLSYFLSQGNNWRKTWTDLKGNPITTISFKDYANSKGWKMMNKDRYREYFDEVCKEDGVYEVGLSWKGKGGHCTIVKREKGRLKYIEPQLDNSKYSKRYWDDIDNLCKSMTAKPWSLDGVIRADNALFDISYIEIFDKNPRIPLHTQRILNNAAIRHAKRSVKEINEIKARAAQRQHKQEILRKAAERHANRNNTKMQERWDRWKKERDLMRQTANNIFHVSHDYPWVDTSKLMELYSKNRSKELVVETRRIAKEISEIKKWRTQVSDVIPDVKKWESQFSKTELQQVYDSVKKKETDLIAKYNGDSYLKANSTEEEYLLKKYKFEAYDYLGGNMYNVQSKYITWQVSQEAYINKIAKIEYNIKVKTISADLPVLKAFSSGKTKKLNALIDEVEQHLANGDVQAAENSLAQAKSQKAWIEKQRAKSASRKNSANADSDVGKAEAYTQARKDNAMWARNPEDGDNYFRQFAEDDWKRWSQNEKEVAYNYTSGSSYINEPLYTKYYSTKYGVHGEVRNSWDDINTLTEMIDKSVPFTQDVWLNRGCSVGEFMGQFGIDLNSYRTQTSKLIGLEGVQKPFMSTAHSKAYGFVDNGTGIDPDVIYNIYCPKGTKGIYTEPYSAFGGNPDKADWDGTTKYSLHRELEVILQRGTKLRVTKAEYKLVKNGHGSQHYAWVIDVEVIEQPPKLPNVI